MVLSHLVCSNCSYTSSSDNQYFTHIFNHFFVFKNLDLQNYKKKFTYQSDFSKKITTFETEFNTHS